MDTVFAKLRFFGILYFSLVLIACGGGGGSSTNPQNGSSSSSSSSSSGSTSSNCSPEFGEQIIAGESQFDLTLSTSFCTYIYFENGNTSLADNESEITQDISNALSAIQTKLSIADFSLLVNSDENAIDALTGVGGSIGQNKTLTLSLDYSIANSDSIEFWLARQLLKARRNDELANNTTLINALATEGLAIQFAMDVTSQTSVPEEANALDDIQLQETVNNAAAQLDSSNFNFDDWFNGSGDLPINAGYTLGYLTINRYLQQNPGSTAAHAFAVDGSEFSLYIESVDENDPSNSIKSEVSVRTPDINEFNQVPGAEFERQAAGNYGIYFLEGLTNKKEVALTFDDGPSSGFTNQVLQILREHEVKATFFLTGNNLNTFSDLGRDIIADGHTAANHSLAHRHLRGVSPEELWNDSLEPTNDIFEEVLGFRSNLYRPPYGEISDEQINFLNEKGMKVILWSIDTRDWNTGSVGVTDIISAANDNLHTEAIILMHDGPANRQNTVDSLESIITHYRDAGYTFVTVDQLIGVSDRF